MCGTTKAMQTHIRHAVRTLLAIAAILAIRPDALALSGDLQGLNKVNSTNWNSGSPGAASNRQDWKELNYIPCRIELVGGPGTNQFVNVVFPHFHNGIPGFQNMYYVSNSANLLFTETR